MKLIASALAAASALATVTYAEQIWTSHSDYQACANVMMGAELCTEKFYTVSDYPVMGGNVRDTCADIGAFPWCPESEEESINVYANLAVLEYTMPNGNLDVAKWVLDGISKWTGVTLDPGFNGMSKQISNYVCPNSLQSSDGVMTFFWNSDQLDETIFTKKIVTDQNRRCVAMGEEMQFKWGNLHCMGQSAVGNNAPVELRRAVCVTTDDMSSEPGYTEMDMEAAQHIRNELNQLIMQLRNIALVISFLMVFVFTGCCFCCCFCCCCKPCKSGDSAPVITQTTQVQQQAAPAPQQYAAAPAPAPMMPAYAPPMQQAAPYNPYAQPMMQPMQPQQPMGGINLNISNNNTNTN